jgi:SAM-dependent methyltransferase
MGEDVAIRYDHEGDDLEVLFDRDLLRTRSSGPEDHEDASAPQIVPTQQGYDSWAHVYDDEDNPLIALETPQFRRLLGDVRGLTVADIGCGTGRHALAMEQAGARVIGVDFSAGMMSKARAKTRSGSGALCVRRSGDGLAVRVEGV